MNSSELRTVKQFVEENPFVTEAQLRWWIFHKEMYGFGSVCVKVGRRVFIDKLEFNRWLESRRMTVLNDN